MTENNEYSKYKVDGVLCADSNLVVFKMKRQNKSYYGVYIDCKSQLQVTEYVKWYEELRSADSCVKTIKFIAPVDCEVMPWNQVLLIYPYAHMCRFDCRRFKTSMEIRDFSLKFIDFMQGSHDTYQYFGNLSESSLFQLSQEGLQQECFILLTPAKCVSDADKLRADLDFLSNFINNLAKRAEYLNYIKLKYSKFDEDIIYPALKKISGNIKEYQCANTSNKSNYSGFKNADLDDLGVEYIATSHKSAISKQNLAHKDYSDDLELSDITAHLSGVSVAIKAPSEGETNNSTDFVAQKVADENGVQKQKSMFETKEEKESLELEPENIDEILISEKYKNYAEKQRKLKEEQVAEEVQSWDELITVQQGKKYSKAKSHLYSLLSVATVALCFVLGVYSYDWIENIFMSAMS